MIDWFNRYTLWTRTGKARVVKDTEYNVSFLSFCFFFSLFFFGGGVVFVVSEHAWFATKNLVPGLRPIEDSSLGLKNTTPFPENQY